MPVSIAHLISRLVYLLIQCIILKFIENYDILLSLNNKMQKYQILSVIGEGAYGVVLKCRSNQTKELLAIKKFKETEDDELVRKVAMREVKILKNMKNPNVVQLKDAFRRKGIVYLVFEYVENNLLQVLERSPDGLDPQLLQKIIYQLTRGLTYMHSNNVIHRDIKPQNLLISQNNELKICDFGFARSYKKHGQEYTDYVATRWYRPPQLLVGAPYDSKIDMWAVGCIMAQLIDGNPLFPGQNQFDQLVLIQKTLGTLTHEHFQIFLKNRRFAGMQFPKINDLQTLDKRYLGKITQKGMNFLKSTLKLNPNERVSASEALRHPYFENMRVSENMRKQSANTSNLRENNKTGSALKDDYPNSVSNERKKIQTNVYDPPTAVYNFQRERQKTQSPLMQESPYNTRGNKFNNYQSNNQSKVNRMSREEIVNLEFTSKGFNPIHSKSVNKTGQHGQNNVNKMNKVNNKYASLEKGPTTMSRENAPQTQAGFYKNKANKPNEFNQPIEINNININTKSPHATKRISNQLLIQPYPLLKSRNGKNKSILNTEEVYQESQHTFSSTQLPFLMIASQQTQTSIAKQFHPQIPISIKDTKDKQKHKMQYNNPGNHNMNIIITNYHHYHNTSNNKNY